MQIKFYPIMKNNELKFPVGYEKFHKKQLYNFQLNRPYSFGYALFEDMKEAGKRIKSFKGWKREMIKMAENALEQGRDLNAAFYYRAAEFYTKSTDPDKAILYDKFNGLFYKVMENEGIKKYNVPYEDGFLPAIRIAAINGSKGTIIINGGFDSFIEEFYSMMKYFSVNGYDVIGFDGPGQGGALRKYGLPITIEWEKPVKSLLDFFKLKDVTLIGISMGGWLCLRAAAYEPRIKRVIANGHAIDYMKSMPPFLRKIHLWFMEHCRGFMNKMAVMKFEKREGMTSWMVDHMKYITKKTKPLDALELYMDLNTENIHSELVTQDVLILSGSNDHFIPSKMHKLQLEELTNAKSITDRIFTEEEHAQNHCQIGNIELSLVTMIDWINEKTSGS